MTGRRNHCGHPAWKPESAVEYPFPPFLDPYPHFTCGIAPFFGCVIEAQTVLADFDKAKTGIVGRAQTIAFGGDAIAVELSPATIGIVIELLHDIQHRAWDDLGVVGIETFEPVDDLSDLSPRGEP
jgi:hypothetical protein